MLQHDVTPLPHFQHDGATASLPFLKIAGAKCLVKAERRALEGETEYFRQLLDYLKEQEEDHCYQETVSQYAGYDPLKEREDRLSVPVPVPEGVRVLKIDELGG